jgi:acetyl/propionyl-CoA carboxylase alpha subunit
MTEAGRRFRRVAIVNRGEPALRLIHAVREWNRERGEDLRTIALWTDPDRDATFLREADEAYHLGTPFFLDPDDREADGTPRRRSRYVDLGSLRRALVEMRAEAAWPGWGFVAESAAFAELCGELGVVFVGPPASALRTLGEKIAAKRLAEGAGVRVVPWSGGPVGGAEEARAQAERLGFPLLVKAAAGGGGRGIRVVARPEDLPAALGAAAAEAPRAFGEAAVFLEALLGAARHIEVQVLGDVHGALWAVGVRDCSVQRARQKVMRQGSPSRVGPAPWRAGRGRRVPGGCNIRRLLRHADPRPQARGRS